jgi:hypothetical protein
MFLTIFSNSLEIPESVITISKSARSAKCEILILPNFEESTNKILVSEDSITAFLVSFS